MPLSPSWEESASFLHAAVPFPRTKLRIFWSSRLIGGFVVETLEDAATQSELVVHAAWSERRGALEKSSRKGNLKISNATSLCVDADGLYFVMQKHAFEVLLSLLLQIRNFALNQRLYLSRTVIWRHGQTFPRNYRLQQEAQQRLVMNLINQQCGSFMSWQRASSIHKETSC
jgi:hypothetical protein